MRGQYLFYFPPRILECLRLATNMRGPFVLPNTVPDEGEREFLRMIARADVTKVSAGGNFFVGLADQVPAEADVLPVTSEPSVLNGYARQAVTRDSVGWPTEISINGNQGIRTITVTFTATGGNFNKPFTRAFLASTNDDTGVLFSYSGALTTAITLLEDESFDMQFELFMS